MLRLLCLLAVVAAGCLPLSHSVEGKTCSVSDECDEGQTCDFGRCLPPSALIPSSRMSIRDVSFSPETAPYLIDGNLDTKWDTEVLPAEVTIDLGSSYRIDGWTYTSYLGWTSVARYEVYVSDDPTAWGQAVDLAGVSVRDFTARFSPKEGRYIRLVFPGGADTAGYFFTSEVGIWAIAP